jgi:hypothetical protein
MIQNKEITTLDDSESDDKKIFSYDVLQINENLFLQMKEQVEDELLINFNREVQKQPKRL